jgi:hypothetical protein
MQDEPFGDLLRVLTEEALLATSALVVAPPRDVLDWEYLRDMRKLTADFRSLFRWRSHCLRDGKAYTYDDFRSLEDVKKRYDTQPPEP